MAIQEMRRAWAMIRSGHRRTVQRIVRDFKDGKITGDVAHVDIQSVTDQVRVGSDPEVLFRHHMISEETYRAVKDLG